ncbi:MAG: ABC transporter ATP-binding protein [Clostridia bacterium]|nr:ABC transporter ATP-binding protein [Clostridia bacterium]
MKKNEDKKDFKSISHTIFVLMSLSKEARIWFFLKCINGATMGIVYGILMRYIEYFTNAAVNKDMTLFKQTTVVYLILLAFMVLTRFFGPFMGNRYSMYTIRDIKRKILLNIHDLKINYFDDKHSGDIVTKLTNDVTILENFISNDMATLFGYLPGALGYAIISMFIMNTRLSLLVLPIVLLASYFTMKFSFRMRGISNQRQKYISNMNMILRDILENIGIVKIYNLNDHYFKKYDEELSSAQKEENKVYKNNQIISVIGFMVRIIPYVSVFFIGIYFIGRNQLTISQMVGFSALSGYSFGNLQNLYAIIAHAAESTGAMDHINEISNEKKERVDGSDFSSVNHADAFEFSHVFYDYVEGITVINDMSFSIKRGSKTALVGESGCGKSTVVKLIQGYYDNYTGDILINGLSIKEWSLKALRSNYSYVSQDEYLFSDSIRNNIMYGKISATEEEFNHVCTVTGVNEIAEEQENGYDSMIGERGVQLSGGQRQRIHLARALLSDNQFILLDEPTSSLDTRSEYYIEKAIQNTGENKTIVIIAHRLSTIINCDDIIVIKAGKTVESGTHESLMNKKGEYYHLYNSQEVL